MVDREDDTHDWLFDELEASAAAREEQPEPVPFRRAEADASEPSPDTDDPDTSPFGPDDNDELIDRWADEGQFESLQPNRNWSNVVAVLVLVGVVAVAVAGGWALLRRSEAADENATATDGEDAEAGSVLEGEPPSLDELTSDVTLPPGPAEGLRTSEHGITVVQDRFDETRREGTYAVLIDNPHDDWLAQGVQVSVDFLAADGRPLGSDSGFVEVVLPGQRVAVAALFFDAPAEPITDLRIELDVARWRETEPFGGSFAIDNVETTAAQYSGVVTRFEITSRFDEPLTDVAVTAVYRDASGRIIGGYDTFVELLEPGVPTPTEVSLLANIDLESVASTELYPVATFGFVPGE